MFQVKSDQRTPDRESQIGTDPSSASSASSQDTSPIIISPGVDHRRSVFDISLGPIASRGNSVAAIQIEDIDSHEHAVDGTAKDAFDSGSSLGSVDEPGIQENIQSDSKTENGQDGGSPRGRHTRESSMTFTDQSSSRSQSPWTSVKKIFSDTNGTKLRKAAPRQRATSGPTLQNTIEYWKQKSFVKPLSLSRRLSDKRKSAYMDGTRSSASSITETSPSSSIPNRFRKQSETPRPASLPMSPTIVTQPNSTDNSQTHIEIQSNTSLRLPPNITRLRRSSSDQSLQLHSAISTVSTLGDDTRFERVQAQVNAHAIAIKNSIQDSLEDVSIKLPSLPSLPSITNLTNLSNLSFESLKPDFTILKRNQQLLSDDLDSGGARPRRSQTLPIGGNRDLSRSFDIGPAKVRSKTKAQTMHPHLQKACDNLTGDLVVLGGYRGSILRSSDPPHRQLWVPIKVGLNIRKVNLEVGLSVPKDDEDMPYTIIPDGMLTHIGPFDISKRLLKRMRASDNAQTGRLRVHDFGYDWRLDPLFLSSYLIKYLESLPCNQPGLSPEQRGATVIAHSLGGLITRHVVNRRPDLFRGVVYAGTPSRCVNILGPLRNGDDVLWSSRVLTAQVNMTIRTSFALLPLDGECFFNKDTGEKYNVDFFNAQDWLEYRLTPCAARPLPALSQPDQSSGVIDGLLNSITATTAQLTEKIQFPLFSKNQKSEDETNNNHDNDSNNILPSIPQPSLEPTSMDNGPGNSVATAVTITKEQTMEYLTTVLGRVKQFKQELDVISSRVEANLYPPAAVIYGKSIATVYGARVKDREAIKRLDAYDDLAFASGDGVVLAKAAMLPDGYELAKGGMISTKRAHVSLLGDLDAVGRALNAVIRARNAGVGRGR